MIICHHIAMVKETLGMQQAVDADEMEIEIAELAYRIISMVAGDVSQRTRPTSMKIS
ncbi:MAG: hypothetical protein ACTXOO_03310 [Sodalis sp. (in: enterobacteria)]